MHVQENTREDILSSEKYSQEGQLLGEAHTIQYVLLWVITRMSAVRVKTWAARALPQVTWG